MKTNDYLLLTATATYSYLFFEQNAGINFLLFNIVLISVFLVRNKNLLRNRSWLCTAGLSLISAASVFVHSSALSILANCVSLLILSALSYNPKTSSVFSFLFSLFSVLASPVFMIIDAVKRSRKRDPEISAGRNTFKFAAILLALVLCVIFFAIYKNANPLFAENTKWLNLDFISFASIMFTFGGLILVYGLFYHHNIPVIEKWENGLKMDNPLNEETDKKPEQERFSGTLFFIFLNLMLIILNAGDITSIWFNGVLPEGITHSDFVHNGVGMIILSIIIATSLIMFLYRKNYGNTKYSGILNVLIYLWIFQNLVMLFSTVWRNQIYIHTFNFTYKRIGVYVWICLAAIGLVITFIKILKRRSNWYLVKNNIALWFAVLVISGTVNWDILITRYNINNKPLREVDFYYLFSLSDSNIPELLEVTWRPDFSGINDSLKHQRIYDQRYYHTEYLPLLKQKIKHYMRDYKSSWQSFDLRDKRIINTLIKKAS